MKKKNGLKTAHWILLAITAVSLVAGIVLCLVAKVDFYKLFPIIISAVGLVVTIVLDGIGSKKEKRSAHEILLKKLKQVAISRLEIQTHRKRVLLKIKQKMLQHRAPSQLGTVIQGISLCAQLEKNGLPPPFLLRMGS